MPLERRGAERLTGFRTAEVYDVPAAPPGTEIVVERHHSMNLGPRQVERLGDRLQGIRRHEPDGVLNRVQNGKQRPGLVPPLAAGLLHRRLFLAGERGRPLDLERYNSSGVLVFSHASAGWFEES